MAFLIKVMWNRKAGRGRFILKLLVVVGGGHYCVWQVCGKTGLSNQTEWDTELWLYTSNYTQSHHPDLVSSCLKQLMSSCWYKVNACQKERKLLQWHVYSLNKPSHNEHREWMYPRGDQEWWAALVSCELFICTY